jgi:hypothetical protein
MGVGGGVEGLCYVVFNSQMINATEVQIFKWHFRTGIFTILYSTLFMRLEEQGLEGSSWGLMINILHMCHKIIILFAYNNLRIL